MIALALALLVDAPGPHPEVVIAADWLRMPKPDDFNRFYPARALEEGVEGEATMNCKVRPDGTLTLCRIVREAPAGKGFGAATLKLASRYQMTTTTRDGFPVADAQITIPVRWRLN